jgi:hypothetical protein
MPTRDALCTRMEFRNAYFGVHSNDLDVHQGGAVWINSTGCSSRAGTAVAKITSWRLRRPLRPTRQASTTAPANCAL